MSQFVNNPELSDIVLLSNDGGQFAAHKVEFYYFRKKLKFYT